MIELHCTECDETRPVDGSGTYVHECDKDGSATLLRIRGVREFPSYLKDRP